MKKFLKIATEKVGQRTGVGNLLLFYNPIKKIGLKKSKLV